MTDTTDRTSQRGQAGQQGAPRSSLLILAVAALAASLANFDSLYRWLWPPPKPAVRSMRTVYRHLGRKRFERALAEARGLVKEWPASAAARVALVRSLSACKKVEEAATELKKATERFPRHHSLWALKGELDLKAAHYDEAKEAYTRVIGLQADHVPSLLALADIAVKQKDFDEGISMAETVLRYHKRSGRAHRVLSHCYQGLGKTDKAVRHARRATELGFFGR